MNALASAIGGLARINGVLLEACRILCIVLVGSIAGVLAAGVFWRYVLQDSLSWSDEVAKYLMVWLVFAGAPIAMRMGDHVAISILPNLLPARLRAAFMAALTVIVISFCLVLGYYSFLFAWNGWGQIAISVGRLPLFWIFVSVPLGMALIGLVAAQQILEHVADVIKPGSIGRDPTQARFATILSALSGE